MYSKEFHTFWWTLEGLPVHYLLNVHNNIHVLPEQILRFGRSQRSTKMQLKRVQTSVRECQVGMKQDANNALSEQRVRLLWMCIIVYLHTCINGSDRCHQKAAYTPHQNLRLNFHKCFLMTCPKNA